MGRLVTSKGRRIYIPDKGEENPFAKESSGKNKNSDKMIDMMKESYIQVMGKDKWDSLSDEQKHDAIMGIAKGATAWREAAENKTVSENEAKKEKELAANKAQAVQAGGGKIKSEAEYRERMIKELASLPRGKRYMKRNDLTVEDLKKKKTKILESIYDRAK